MNGHDTESPDDSLQYLQRSGEADVEIVYPRCIRGCFCLVVGILYIFPPIGLFLSIHKLEKNHTLKILHFGKEITPNVFTFCGCRFFFALPLIDRYETEVLVRHFDDVTETFVSGPNPIIFDKCDYSMNFIWEVRVVVSGTQDEDGYVILNKFCALAIQCIRENADLYHRLDLREPYIQDLISRSASIDMQERVIDYEVKHCKIVFRDKRSFQPVLI